MAKIKVHLLNFHGPVTHVHILLEMSTDEGPLYYLINRRGNISPRFEKDFLVSEPYSMYYFQSDLKIATSQFSFEIEADPNEIVNKWRDFSFNRSTSLIENHK